MDEKKNTPGIRDCIALLLNWKSNSVWNVKDDFQQKAKCLGYILCC